MLEVDSGRVLDRVLAREGPIRQDEVGDAEGVLEKFCQEVFVSNGGSTSRGNRRRRRRPEVDRVAVRLPLGRNCHSEDCESEVSD